MTEGGRRRRLTRAKAHLIASTDHNVTRPDLKAPAARGWKGGRQPKLTPEHTAQILDGLGSRRKSAADLARLFRVHRATTSRLAVQAQVTAAPAES